MEELYVQYKGLMFKIAYQMTGSVADAEDIVQDVFIKLYDVDPDRLAKPKAYLCKMVTRRSIDLLKSARKRREQYFGPWLPEPAPTPEMDAMEAVVRNDLLSYAMMVLLEHLSPAERAVFVLREALGFEYPLIAELLDKNEVSCRKMMSRARGKMGISENIPVSNESNNEEWVRLFLTELEKGNINKVMELLSEDVLIVSDSGGRAIAAMRPIQTRELAARFLLGAYRKAPKLIGGLDIGLANINGQIGIVARSGSKVVAVAFMHFERGKLRNLYIQRNSDKLKHIL
ncbi:RNA polymerase sigma factor SigJ [Paenibacillus sp. XY044]|uniref:RNA polymerase sigma factor SigJ n=1 Tax=Paenibacillus sp. XY044 TaxID=2026089 RepID=UPI000B97D22A|nr:RNA polymerase subunit sigma-24 [Paenibacillus sp. XY044]